MSFWSGFSIISFREKHKTCLPHSSLASWLHVSRVTEWIWICSVEQHHGLVCLPPERTKTLYSAFCRGYCRTGDKGRINGSLCLWRWRLLRSVWGVPHIRSCRSSLPRGEECSGAGGQYGQEYTSVSHPTETMVVIYVTMGCEDSAERRFFTLSLAARLPLWFRSSSSTGRLPPRQAQWTAVESSWTETRMLCNSG